MILPRRLITPSMKSGALGTAVISGTRTISRTEPMRTPYVSLPIRKPTTWRSFSIQEISGPSGTRQFGIFKFALLLRAGAAALARGFASAKALLLTGTVQNEAIHTVEQIARELEHLFGRRRKFGGACRGLLAPLTHLVHRAND